MLWTDDDNLKLVQSYFPWLEDTFLELPGPIYRADLVRNLYMYMFGGLVPGLALQRCTNARNVPANQPEEFTLISIPTTYDRSTKPSSHSGSLSSTPTKHPSTMWLTIEA